jgi:uncharacterized damage-inducible protein DinB
MKSEQPSLKEILFWDLERELAVTRKVLSRLPEDRFGWTPHLKSMNLGRLAMHVATLPGWIRTAIAEDGIDSATMPPMRQTPNDSADLLAEFDKHATLLLEAVRHFDERKIMSTWTLRNGEHIMTSQPRLTIYRTWSLNHLVHHRAQLCVYLRLLDLPVPAVYFNSSDEPAWVFE